MGRHLICGGDFGAERRCFGELSKKQDDDMDNLKVGDSHRGRPILQGVRAVCRFRPCAEHSLGGDGMPVAF